MRPTVVREAGYRTSICPEYSLKVSVVKEMFIFNNREGLMLVRLTLKILRQLTEHHRTCWPDISHPHGSGSYFTCILPRVGLTISQIIRKHLSVFFPKCEYVLKKLQSPSPPVCLSLSQSTDRGLVKLLRLQLLIQPGISTASCCLISTTSHNQTPTPPNCCEGRN